MGSVWNTPYNTPVIGKGVDATLYRNHVAHILSHTVEDVFRMQLLCNTSNIMAKQSEVGILHLGVLTTQGAHAQINAAFNSDNNTSQTSLMDVDDTQIASEVVSRMRSASYDVNNLEGNAVSPKAPKVVLSDEDDDSSDNSEEGSNGDNSDTEEEEKLLRKDEVDLMDVEEEEDDEDDEEVSIVYKNSMMCASLSFV